MKFFFAKSIFNIRIILKINSLVIFHWVFYFISLINLNYYLSRSSQVIVFIIFNFFFPIVIILFLYTYLGKWLGLLNIWLSKFKLFVIAISFRKSINHACSFKCFDRKLYTINNTSLIQQYIIAANTFEHYSFK